MENSKIIKWCLAGLALVFVVIVISSFISWSNTEVGLRNSFSQKMDERTAFYDKMAKVFNQKTQIAVKNDDSFRKNINIIMENRKDSQAVVFKWITEANPNANYDAVASIYQDLSRAIEAQREGFFFQEKFIQDIVRQHTDHLNKFPGSLINSFYGRDLLKYKVIQSTLTEEVMKTGTDNYTKLDL